MCDYPDGKVLRRKQHGDADVKATIYRLAKDIEMQEPDLYCLAARRRCLYKEIHGKGSAPESQVCKPDMEVTITSWTYSDC
jgi:hypothetical protein